jgi:tRNA (guanine-N7-)-methyltransferase
LRGLATPRRRHDFFSVLELTSDVDRLDLEKIFGRSAPLHVDLGCGDGAFLCAMAERTPEKNFIGIERLLRRVRRATRKALDNVRILRQETFHVVRHLLPPGSVEAFYLLFPDPWPKRRHHRRRIVTPEFLSALAEALENQGTIHIATDQRDYFEQIARLAEQSNDFEIVDLTASPARTADPARAASPARTFPATTFEKKYKSAGAPIYRLELRKVSSVT